MLERLFSWLGMAMADSLGVAVAASFAWGVLSILLSPCHLASIPLVIGYIVKHNPGTAGRSLGLSTTFAAGILATIALLGVITAGLGRLMGDIGPWGNLLVAAVFVVFGLHLMGVIRLWWNPLAARPVLGNPWFGALVLGLVFGVGLGPCTFAYLAPVLGLVFSLAPTSMASATLLVAAFGLGHCSVIAGAGSLAHTVQRYLIWTDQSNVAVWIQRVAGFLVLLGGVTMIWTTF